MKNYNELDEFKKKSIDDYLSLTKMFISIFATKEFGEESISLMKQNHSLMRIALQDLGVKFENEDKIKELRETVRNMESKQNMGDISFNKISAYIDNLKKEVKDRLESIGLSCSISVSFMPNIRILIDIFSSEEREPNKMFYKDKDEFDKDKLKYIEKHKLFKENFIYEEYDDNEKELIAIYNQANIDRIVESLESLIGLKHDYLNVQIQNRFKKGFVNGKIIQNFPMLKTVEIDFYTLQNDIFLKESFSSFR